MTDNTERPARARLERAGTLLRGGAPVRASVARAAKSEQATGARPGTERSEPRAPVRAGPVANRLGRPRAEDLRKKPDLPPAPPPQPWLLDAIKRGETETFALIAEIGRGEARELLTRNPANRLIGQAQVAKLVRDISTERWQFNGESIVVADSGELNDGQHRLAAVEFTGLPIRSVIVFGVPRASRETLDMGKARGTADWLGLHGVTHSTTVAAAARLVMAYEFYEGKKFGNTQHFSVGEMLDRVLGDPELQDVGRHANTLYQSGGKGLAQVSVVAACTYLLQRVDPAAGLEFIDRVCIGDRLERGTPAFETRRSLMMLPPRTPRVNVAGIILWGWHYHRRGHSPAEITPKLPLPDLNPKPRP